MHRTRVKICGIRTLETALQAADAGADALGFVFYAPSPRAVTGVDAARIIDELPPFLTTVGLFVDADRPTVKRIVKQTRLDLLQFHGNETEAFCNSFDRPYIKAVRVKTAADISAALVAYPSAKALLLDAYVDGIPGGTGKAFDWLVVPQTQANRFILAGGLNADNVAGAIEQVKPYAIDVSGGVESEKGVKDAQKIVQFMTAVTTA